ncbi:uncharacterized protein VP01_4895g1 [Puccinia sorghi]|uniref:Uncharacterized protein n=1 Tax=Puccinia sorghi TaxID=27349 RepID=A0A0L6UMX2_9BASI|nr:uncharacterized protein VP01_4895g1 [Puccinia sorghi]
MSHWLTQPQPPSLFLEKSCHPATLPPRAANPWALCEEHAQQLATEEKLQITQAFLDSTAGQQNPAPAQPNPTLAPASNPMVLSKPQPFDGTRGATTEAFVGKIGLHAITQPKRFPNNASKLVFTVLFMKDYTATWSQPTSARMEPCRHTHRTLTSTPAPLLAVVMSNIEFDSLRSMQVMALKAGQTIGGIRQGCPPTPSPVTVPAPPPPTLMGWTSLHSRRSQESNSPTLSKPLGSSGTSVSIVARWATHPQQGSRAPRPSTALVFHPALQTSGRDQLSPRQPQHQ